jgi:glycosyltransferase involved in cell wall biosynthesis
MRRAGRRLAFVVSHPIQYYAPLHQLLAEREDLEIKVFFTWHAGAKAVRDPGFGAEFSWDIALTRGYDFELVPNTASRPGTQSFFGLENPSLASRLTSWKPDVVHVTGWAWRSHLGALRQLRLEGVPVLFRGDSHLLDGATRGPRWWMKRALLRRVFSWPAAFLYAGSANRAYFEAFGVPPEELLYCPHSIDVGRFAEQAESREQEASNWRRELRFEASDPVMLFAGKFERKKRPVELVREVLGHGDQRMKLLLVGGGELSEELHALAVSHPGRVQVLPFQNQSRMPVVYRLGDLFVLPSGWGETWGLAVNEALACGRPVLVSDRVGCAADVIDPSCGRQFPWNDWRAMTTMATELLVGTGDVRALRSAALRRAWNFDVSKTAESVVRAVEKVTRQ